MFVRSVSVKSSRCSKLTFLACSSFPLPPCVGEHEHPADENARADGPERREEVAARVGPGNATYNNNNQTNNNAHMTLTPPPYSSLRR